MRDELDDGPADHLVRLLQVILGLIVINVVAPCTGALYGFPEFLQGATGLSRGVVALVFCLTPGVLILVAAVLGVGLARSGPSRWLFAVAGLFGLVYPILLLFLTGTLR